MDSSPFFSIVIVSLNGGGVIGRALDAIRRTEYDGYEVIVVDNGSTDNLVEVVRRDYPEVRSIRSPINLGFAGGNNLGIREAQGDIVVLLNDDTEVRPGWLAAWAKTASECPGWGILGCKLLYPDGHTIQHAGGRIEPNGQTKHIGYEQEDDGRFDQIAECDYVTGAAIALRREMIARVGLLDEKFYPIYFEETDYCHRAKRFGYEVLYAPKCVVIHHESRTQVRFSFRFVYRYTRCRIRFVLKWFTFREMLRAAWYELRWWFQPYSYECYLPYLWAYLHALVHFPMYLRDRRIAQRSLDALVGAMKTRSTV